MDLNHLNLSVRNPAACRDFYQRHFGFEPAFEAEGGYFLRNERGSLLALLPATAHQPHPDGFHVGFGVDSAGKVIELHAALSGGRTTAVEDFRPAEDYVTFRAGTPTARRSRSSGRRREALRSSSPRHRRRPGPG